MTPEFSTSDVVKEYGSKKEELERKASVVQENIVQLAYKFAKRATDKQLESIIKSNEPTTNPHAEEIKAILQKEYNLRKEYILHKKPENKPVTSKTKTTSVDKNKGLNFSNGRKVNKSNAATYEELKKIAAKIVTRPRVGGVIEQILYNKKGQKIASTHTVPGGHGNKYYVINSESKSSDYDRGR